MTVGLWSDNHKMELSRRLPAMRHRDSRHRLIPHPAGENVSTSGKMDSSIAFQSTEIALLLSLPDLTKDRLASYDVQNDNSFWNRCELPRA